jgi:hypothetical protein
MVPRLIERYKLAQIASAKTVAYECEPLVGAEIVDPETI